MSSSQTNFEVKFWGVRGSVACPTESHIGYGGNTSCVEVRVNDQIIILDAGTGIRELGMQLQREDICRATLLLSHTHWDHINGFPFFTPAYDPEMSLAVMAGHCGDAGGIQQALSGQMSQPFFPIPLQAMRGALSFTDFTAGESFALGDDVNVRTCKLHHPNGATGYRIEANDRSLCYVTDTEHVSGQTDREIQKLIGGSDLVIYDCTYTDEEFPAKIGWGHSTWEEGMRLCRKASVKSLAIFHHDPSHDDRFMDEIAVQAKAQWDQAFVAREGMSINLM